MFEALLANFDLMIVLATNKLIMRSKLKKALLANFDLMKMPRSGDQIVIWNFDLMKNAKFC